MTLPEDLRRRRPNRFVRSLPVRDDGLVAIDEGSCGVVP
jgi:hypothetical protein